jgi:hypothetical protein
LYLLCNIHVFDWILVHFLLIFNTIFHLDHTHSTRNLRISA